MEKKNKMRQNSKDKFLLVLKGNWPFILLLSFFLVSRLYKFSHFFVFDLDEEYQALLSWSIVKDFHILWIGVSASNVGYYLGPGLVYLGAILLKISQGNPLILGYFAVLVGLSTLISLYYISNNLFSKKVALIASILYSFSPFALYYDRKFWPLAVPLTSLWLFYSLVMSRKNQLWLLLSGLLMGISYHLHLTLWLFWPLIIYSFAYLIVKKKLKLFTLVSSVIVFVVSTLPLLIFDFLHNFDNLLFPFRLLTNSATSPPNFVHSNVRMDSFSAGLVKILLPVSFSQFWHLTIPGIFLVVLVLVWSKPTIQHKLLSVLLVLFFLGFVFFPSPMQEYYFVFPLPFLVILVGEILGWQNKIITWTVITIFISINIVAFFSKPRYSDYLPKLTFIRQTKQAIKNKPFYLETKGDYRYFGGWRYLFQSQGLTPGQSSADSMFGWIYPDEILPNKPSITITIPNK